MVIQKNCWKANNSFDKHETPTHQLEFYVRAVLESEAFKALIRELVPDDLALRL